MNRSTKPSFVISGNIQATQVNVANTIRMETVSFNINSDLDSAADGIKQMPVEDTTKEELLKQVSELKANLLALPAEKSPEAQKVAKELQKLVTEVNKQKPDKKKIKISGENLKKAAKNIAEVMPIVLSIATNIVTHILKMGM